MKTAEQYARQADYALNKALYPEDHGSHLSKWQREMLMNAANVYIQLAQYQSRKE